MELYYTKKIQNENFILEEEEAHHCTKVMRHSVGDELMITDGEGKLMLVELISAGKREVRLKLKKIIREEEPPSPGIHIAIAPIKSIDRFEWFLEKATEIGINEVTPVICARSEREKIKPERLNKILIAAMKQSLRLWMPKLHPLSDFSSFLNSAEIITSKFICHCQSQELPSFKSLLGSKQNAMILIGPEGDFSADEIESAEKNMFVSVSLSPARLRTETAAIVAVQTVRLICEP